MRLSAIKHPPNAYNVNIHLGAAGLKKLKELQEVTGMSRSAIVRTLVMAAKVKQVQTFAANQEEPNATASQS